MQLLIQPDGTIRCLYAEVFSLATLGSLVIARGSHVEPDCDGQWWADLFPVTGPKLGPYAQRSQALQAEVHWLEAHWLNGPLIT